MRSLLSLPVTLCSQMRETEREESTWMADSIFKIYQVWPFFLTSIIFACHSISLLNGLSDLILLPPPPKLILYLTFTVIPLKFTLEPCSMAIHSTLSKAKVPIGAHTVFSMFSDPACVRTPVCPLCFNPPPHLSLVASIGYYSGFQGGP